MIACLELPALLFEQLKQEARAAFPRECCGFVEGIRRGAVAQTLALHSMPNLAPEPDSFAIDPTAQIALLRGLRGTGCEIIGCYHSHPNGRPEPSQRDIAGAGETNFLWLIAALEGTGIEPAVACFVWTGAAFAPLRIEVG
jgi:proteasome lid subunit RPN8/RPN11